ncbi:MAG: hypothetical protein KGL39_42895, partial [Patescibacteria group bacterium]|nr:hypothetical protein [Patescibacteria group bacterium]
ATKGLFTLWKLRTQGEDQCDLDTAIVRWVTLLAIAFHGRGCIASGEDDFNAFGPENAGRPKSRGGRHSITREARIEILAMRRELGLDLWHSGDTRDDPVMAIVWRRIQIEEEGRKKWVKREFLVNARDRE